MEGPRPPRESEWSEVISFLDQQLRPQLSWSIANEYPTALVPTNAPNVRIVTDNNRVVSHAVLKPLIIKTPFFVLKVGAVGSVVTDSNYRNQGLAAQLILECLTEARRQDCDLAILWTDKHDYYRKLNFELAGFEESFFIDKEFAAPSEGLRFMKSTQVSPESLLKLYNQHTVNSFRTQEDIRKFLQIPQTHLFTAWDAQGQLVAYAVEGKGVDLNGYVHEWGGGVSKLLALFSWMRKERKKPFTVIVPHHSVNLTQALGRSGAHQHSGFLGMIRIVCAEQFLTKLNKAVRMSGVEDLSFAKKDQGYIVHLGNRSLEISDERDFIRFVFGPATEVPGLTAEEEKKKNRFVPFPLWIWGWDSV